jgi:hypothetical protein
MAGYNFQGFIQKADHLFQQTLENYGYERQQVKVNDIRGIAWSVHLIYINAVTQLKISIKQEPYYSDYGFSIFIEKIGTNEYNILYNVPHERQDKEDNFLKVAYEDLFSTPPTVDLISGKWWEELHRIPFQK